MHGDAATCKTNAHAKGRWSRGGIALALVMGLAITPIAIVLGSSPAGATGTTYMPGTPALATIADPSGCSQTSCEAPWNEWQGDPSSPTYASQSPGAVLQTYEDGGAPTTTDNGPATPPTCATAPCPITEPNLSVVPGAGSGTDGIASYPSGVVGTPGPLDAYCGAGTNMTESSGTPARQPAGTTLPPSAGVLPPCSAQRRRFVDRLLRLPAQGR